MELSAYETHIRDHRVVVNVEFEESLGVYGRTFWDGIRDGEYEADTFDFIDLMKNSGSRSFIDVGSATGCMVLYASSLGIHVVGTEPQEKIFEALQRNVDLNPNLKSRIDLKYCLVVCNQKSGENPNSQNPFFTEGASGPLSKVIEAEQVSLIEILKDSSVTDLVSLKMDIEGAEYSLLQDQETISRLSELNATLFLSFHPGFQRPLSLSPSIFELWNWRLKTLLSTWQLSQTLNSCAKISLLNTGKNLSTPLVVLKIIQGQRDFLIKF